MYYTRTYSCTLLIDMQIQHTRTKLRTPFRYVMVRWIVEVHVVCAATLS